jgi:hypothetical protein
MDNNAVPHNGVFVQYRSSKDRYVVTEATTWKEVDSRMNHTVGADDNVVANRGCGMDDHASPQIGG